MNEEYWTKEVDQPKPDKIMAGGTPTWKKALNIMLLAPKVGILLAPLFISKFMAKAPWLGLAVSEAFIKNT